MLPFRFRHWLWTRSPFRCAVRALWRARSVAQWVITGDCGNACGLVEPYGWVAQAGCPVHDGRDAKSEEREMAGEMGGGPVSIQARLASPVVCPKCGSCMPYSDDGTASCSTPACELYGRRFEVQTVTLTEVDGG